MVSLPGRNRQSGIALTVILTIILLAVTASLITVLPINEQRTGRIQNNGLLLEQANQALLGYALEHTIPGTLPCPDNNGDGLENPQGPNCATQLGLLPYRTINMPRSVDGSGALLWYAVELNYVANAGLRNPSTISTLTLNGNQQAAIVIAPGPALDGQGRAELVIADFLEGVNADANLSTYDNIVTDSQNDQLLGIPKNRFWSLIEKIVTSSAQDLLSTYRANCGEYPFAADFGGPYDSVLNQQHGAMPFDSALPTDWGTACGASTAPTPSAWLSTHWREELLYRMCLSAEGNCLTVAGSPVTPASAVIVAPGVELTGQTRPSSDPLEYFEANNSSAPDSSYSQFRMIDYSSTYNDTSLALVP